MVRKAMFALIAVIVLMMLLVVAFASLSGKPPAPVVKRATPPPPPATWDGTGSRNLTASFTRACLPGTPAPPSNSGSGSGSTCEDQITVQNVSFSGLRNAGATVSVALQVTPGAPGSWPGWLTPNAFKGYAANGYYLDPLVKIIQYGNNLGVNVEFKNIPTSWLGPTAAVADGGQPDSQSNLRMLVYSPDGLFAVQLQAPAAPNGFKLADQGGGYSYAGHPQTALDQALNTDAARRSQGLADTARIPWAWPVNPTNTYPLPVPHKPKPRPRPHHHSKR